ncbi:MAG: TniB family NTP-binding protein [Holophaga sp.]|nr:TniB family NTP-binding protein [Holophaga sp.]
MIDELHQLIAGGEMRKRIIIDELKALSNELKIALVAAGTSRALQVIRLDDQYLSRMPPVILPPWGLNRSYLGLLKALERRLPLREASMLTNRNLAELIYTHSKKTIGNTISLVLEATRLALSEGREQITEDLIKRAVSGDLPWMKV